MDGRAIKLLVMSNKAAFLKQTTSSENGCMALMCIGDLNEPLNNNSWTGERKFKPWGREVFSELLLRELKHVLDPQQEASN
jgi:hypothetical protein